MTGINLEYATDNIWTMEDKPGFIGIRFDCGDAGVVYLTPSQAHDLATCLLHHLKPVSVEAA